MRRLAEINPLLITGAGDVLALDAKMNFDSNALFRHKDLVEMRDLEEENPLEVEAGKHGLNYIKLDGNIACMVNGAGLAMSTMDIIKLYGGEPANFLDVGGSASQDAVKAAFQILVSDPAVEAVLINIFGGIARTDRIAVRCGRRARRAGQRRAAGGGAARGHQRRARPRDPAGGRLRFPGRPAHGRRGRESGGRGWKGGCD